MTRSVEIPEAAVEAAIDVVMDDGHNGIQCAPDRNLAVTVRAALEAARPHIEAAMCNNCPTDAGVTSAMRTETGQHLATCPLALYPAPAVPQPAGRYRLAWLSARRRASFASKAFFAEARAARELEAAVPQPVDREALAEMLAANPDAVRRCPARGYANEPCIRPDLHDGSHEWREQEQGG